MNKKKKKLIRIIVILLLLTVICFSSVAYLKKRRESDEVTPNQTPGNNDSHVNTTIDPVEQALRNETYFLERNLTRYLSYAKKYPDKEPAEVVRSVNANIDYDFYTNDTASNLADGILVLVNKYHKLPSDYEPDLVSMSSTYTYGTFQMQREAYEHFKDMCDNASVDGIHLYNVSAYRSYSRQETLYNNYVKQGGQEYADNTSARAGYSEHQTGLVSDIITADSNSHFENTKEYAWLKENSYKYGFIERFPQGKEYITGYEFEPWHYRYVGVEVATYIQEHQITFDEYYAYFIEK